MLKIFQSKHFVDEDVRKNFFINLFDGAFFSFAMSLVSLQTVIPIFVKRMGGSDIAIGLIPVLWATGFNFPQIFVANYIRRLGFKKKWMLKTAVLQRFPWLCLAVIIYFLIDSVPKDMALIIFFAGLLFAAFGGSINLPGWFDLISKITPVQLRGRLFAYRAVIGASLGIFGGLIVTKILAAFSYPQNYALLFLLAFLITIISYFFLLMIKEKKPNHAKEHFSYQQFIKKLYKILKEEKNYRNFLVADSLMMLALMSNAFFAVNAVKKFSLPDWYAGLFTIVMMLSMIFGSLYFGYLADRKGHKTNLLWSACFTAFACTAALIAPTIQIYFLVFFGSALTITITQVSRLTIIAEICFEEDRPTYIALTNLITAPFVLSGLLGGWIANSFGYNTVFIIGGLFALAAAFWLTLMVKEPRTQIAINA